MTTPAATKAQQLLQQIGAALFGRDWVSDIATAIQVNRRTVQRWASGAQPIPAGALEAVAQLAEQRAVELAPLATQAREVAALAPPGYWERRGGAQS